MRAGRPTAVSLILLALAGTAADAQTPPPPCNRVLKGRLVGVDAKARTLTVDLSARRDVLPIREEAALTALRDAKPGDALTVQMDCMAKPPVVMGVRVDRQGSAATPGATPTPGPRSTTVLVSTDAACSLMVDFKPAAMLAAGGRTELKLAPGEHLLEATSPDGRTWKEKVKVGSDQVIVEVKLGQPAATVEQYDAQAARLCRALADLKKAGQELDAILRDNKFKFHKADSAAVSTAAAAWARELATLKALVAPAARARVTDELARLDPDVREYADLLVKALQTAQEKNTIMGEAGTLRDKAKARLPLMTLPADATALIPACAV